MNITDNPIIKTIQGGLDTLIKFIDDAYKQGYLLYLILGLIVFAIFIIFFN